jgi:N-acetylmuramic acid 6-phosphate etherase
MDAEPLDPRLTEQRNPDSGAIDELDTLGIVDLINREDRRVAIAVSLERANIARAIDLIVGCMRAGGHLIYVGAGTSGRLGILDAAEMPPTFRTAPELVQGIIAGGSEALVRATEGAEDDTVAAERDIDARGVGPADFVLGIATSGTTPYVHAALAHAKRLGARTGFLLCNEPSAALIERHDVVIAPVVGAEVITGSTRMKAGTATKLVLNTISTATMVRLGKVYGNLMVDLKVTSNKLRDRAVRILVETLRLDRDAATALLDGAAGEVKTAIVMGRSGVSAAEARTRLADAAGVIRDVTDAPDGL